MVEVPGLQVDAPQRPPAVSPAAVPDAMADAIPDTTAPSLFARIMFGIYFA